MLRDKKQSRYEIAHPLISKNGDLIFQSGSPLAKVDFCSNLLWVNDEDVFHHSNNIDHDGNYWVPTNMFPYAIDEKLVGKLD